MARTAALLRLLLQSQTKQISTRGFQTGLHPYRFGTWEQCSSVKHPLANKLERFNPNHLGTPKRWASQAARASSAESDSKISIGPQKSAETNADNKDTGIVYYGPISSTIKKVKLLSLSTCCLSVSLGPVITFMTSPDMNVILKGAVASTVIILSASTTAALHWFVSPYVHKLRWQPGADSFEVEMLSWLATHIPRTIRFADIRLPETNRPFVTFKANNNFYFVDTEHCHNKALLARLTPQKSSHDSTLKNL
ncbi:hypothetical protein MRB53_024821 [Persea americana]|uniref:Uncharacterized protein n=1 Tax=Persea americana TaxID=3435 RepID=A0ACC2LEI7_PERAE|nr:hypothetical protein MRB53_024821 [Persea americana]|eukprot:TRINITY_DN1944_c2_g1_i1.p1 TRINITY_DN1944_c2_g1~~TRINITY_DN1944_c2_g1_i1.p1  ORF type:complete len:252 (+),score=31.87 TRINITY_DN1944_c2_g1_i1:206-961(+)